VQHTRRPGRVVDPISHSSTSEELGIGSQPAKAASGGCALPPGYVAASPPRKSVGRGRSRSTSIGSSAA
jgi:hypothetical protein